MLPSGLGFPLLCNPVISSSYLPPTTWGRGMMPNTKQTWEHSALSAGTIWVLLSTSNILVDSFWLEKNPKTQTSPPVQTLGKKAPPNKPKQVLLHNLDVKRYSIVFLCQTKQLKSGSEERSQIHDLSGKGPHKVFHKNWNSSELQICS